MKDDMQFDYDLMRMKRLQAAEAHDAAPMELHSDYIIGYSKDSGAVFTRHTSDMLFEITPFQKDGDDYFKLNQFGDNGQVVKEMYLCLGELEGLQELVTDFIKRRELMQGGG